MFKTEVINHSGDFISLPAPRGYPRPHFRLRDGESILLTYDDKYDPWCEVERIEYLGDRNYKIKRRKVKNLQRPNFPTVIFHNKYGSMIEVFPIEYGDSIVLPRGLKKEVGVPLDSIWSDYESVTVERPRAVQKPLYGSPGRMTTEMEQVIIKKRRGNKGLMLLASRRKNLILSRAGFSELRTSAGNAEKKATIGKSALLK